MNQNQTVHSQKSPASEQQAPQIPLHCDGLGTFLAIAAERIENWGDTGRLTAAEIDTLHFQTKTTLRNLGAMTELLGMERIDHTADTESSYTMAAALITTGRAMIELVGIQETLECAARRIERTKEPKGKEQTIRDLIVGGV